MTGRTNEILKNLKRFTESVILFHSATGKDSIVLLDLLIKKGFKVQPVFMYMVKGLSFIENYIKYAEKKYSVKFIQVPHYALSAYIKNGTFGIKKDPKQKIFTLSEINKSVCEQCQIDWTVTGFKKFDSMERRIMLNELKDSIQYKTYKCYPLADWTNKECLSYIEINRLIKPILMGKTNQRSTDMPLNDDNFLIDLNKRYPQDMKKIITIFPEVEALLYLANEKEI
jgi:3'-phosphoadenosine 5'-phosphosulfate sulfotransferase (PAPS reductase)/FAD synthetase